MSKSSIATNSVNEEEAPWLITFCDLTMLLLTFFVMKLALGGRVIPSPIPEGVTAKEEMRFDNNAHEPSALAEQIRQTAARSFSLAAGQTPDAEEVSIVKTNSGIILRLGPSSFLENSDTLSYRASELLVTLAKLLREKPAAVQVSWFSAEDNEISTEFPSNWELAAARATTAARQIIDAGVEINAVSAMGFGKMTSSRRITRNDFDTPLHRNGRLEVEITLTKEDPSMYEMQFSDVIEGT